MPSILYFVILFFFKSSLSETPSTVKQQSGELIGETRRILNGNQIYDTRGYMVYLRPTKTVNYKMDNNWVCGGMIIDERHIVTSAACIEDVPYFYVVSGTHKWVQPKNTNECIENGAMRAIWKCVPRTYRYDGQFFNNFKWMVNDIAVVKVEDAFNFQRRIKGCDFIPQKILYNNISWDYEAPGQRAFMAGWGSRSEYTDVFDKTPHSHNSQSLVEAATIIISKSDCKRYWHARYRSIIDNYMICGKWITSNILSSECERHANCRSLLNDEGVGPRRRRFESNPDKLILHSLAQLKKREKNRKIKTRRLFFNGNQLGGFCENDHGGPLTIGHGRNRILIGIISAYRNANGSKKCLGPFLFTSVYNNRFLIECALYREIRGDKCPAVLRDESAVLEEETFDWGPMIPRSYLYEEELRSFDDEKSTTSDNKPVTTPSNYSIATNGEPEEVTEKI